MYLIMEKIKSNVSVLEEFLKKNDMGTENINHCNDLEAANNFYNKLIKDGIIKKRGFTLKGIGEAHLNHSSIKY
jgi:predicted transcriptional regulator